MKLRALTIGLISFAAVAASSFLQAQSPPPPNHEHGERHAQEKLNYLSQQLNLTPEQQTKVQTVFEGMRSNVVYAVREAQTNANTQLQQILTPEQYQQFQSVMQQHERRWKRHGGKEEDDQEDADDPNEPEDNGSEDQKPPNTEP